VQAAGGKKSIPQAIVQEEGEIQKLEGDNDQLAQGYRALDANFRKNKRDEVELNRRFDSDQVTIETQEQELEAGFKRIGKGEADYRNATNARKSADAALVAEALRINKLQQVLSLKAQSEDKLRTQLGSLKDRLAASERSEADATRRVERALQNGTDALRAAKLRGRKLGRRLASLRLRLNVTGRDKEQFRVQREQLLQDNARLTAENSRLQQLQRETRSERESLEREEQAGRDERADLQRELDALEGVDGNGTNATTANNVAKIPRAADKTSPPQASPRRLSLVSRPHAASHSAGLAAPHQGEAASSESARLPAAALLDY